MGLKRIVCAGHELGITGIVAALHGDRISVREGGEPGSQGVCKHEASPEMVDASSPNGAKRAVDGDQGVGEMACHICRCRPVAVGDHRHVVTINPVRQKDIARDGRQGRNGSPIGMPQLLFAFIGHDCVPRGRNRRAGLDPPGGA
jgi:hypothetical protein